MSRKCNKVKREGNCDGMEWYQCTYCGSCDNEPCRDIEVKNPETENQRMLKEALDKIRTQALHPQEVQLILIHILDKINT